ncbi:hypothetical protein OESDEN_12867 [Oesophagostomum dentatum]|uniref:Uncharacterized protein n=1 Tax=Oesophagostomum dentatum TaxID=61180 RepID=A0A0B1STY5_OESDE|nr:hypothetical protein OESDEN_12867 [Oesophagostomum dentatum]
MGIDEVVEQWHMYTDNNATCKYLLVPSSSTFIHEEDVPAQELLPCTSSVAVIQYLPLETKQYQVSGMYGAYNCTFNSCFFVFLTQFHVSNTVVRRKILFASISLKSYSCI